MATNIVKPIPLTSIDSATGVSGTYAAINPNGLPNGCIMIRITNNSTKDVTVSFDGTNDHEYIPTLTSVLLQFQTNAQPNASTALLPLGTKVYVKGTAGTGLIYLAGWYQPNGG
jgi:hypothetical protein